MNTPAWIGLCILVFGLGLMVGLVLGVNAMGRYVRKGGSV